jgi:hypothetical protein
MSIETIKDDTMKEFDSHVSDLPRDEYKDLLEEMISEFEARLDCIKEEIENEEE